MDNMYAIQNLNMTSYKIVYFDAQGRAEISRMILTVAGVKFEDERVKDWPKGILILSFEDFFRLLL